MLHHHPPLPSAAPPPGSSSETTCFLHLLHLDFLRKAATTATPSRINGPCACGGCIRQPIPMSLHLQCRRPAGCLQSWRRSSSLFSFPEATKLTAVPTPTSREPRINSSRCKRAEEYKCFSPQMGLMDVMKH